MYNGCMTKKNDWALSRLIWTPFKFVLPGTNFAEIHGPPLFPPWLARANLDRLLADRSTKASQCLLEVYIRCSCLSCIHVLSFGWPQWRRVTAK